MAHITQFWEISGLHPCAISGDGRRARHVWSQDLPGWWWVGWWVLGPFEDSPYRVRELLIWGKKEGRLTRYTWNTCHNLHKIYALYRLYNPYHICNPYDPQEPYHRKKGPWKTLYRALLPIKKGPRKTLYHALLPIEKGSLEDTLMWYIGIP